MAAAQTARRQSRSPTASCTRDRTASRIARLLGGAPHGRSDRPPLSLSPGTSSHASAPVQIPARPPAAAAGAGGEGQRSRQLSCLGQGHPGWEGRSGTSLTRGCGGRKTSRPGHRRICLGGESRRGFTNLPPFSHPTSLFGDGPGGTDAANLLRRTGVDEAPPRAIWHRNPRCANPGTAAVPLSQSVRSGGGRVSQSCLFSSAKTGRSHLY